MSRTRELLSLIPLALVAVAAAPLAGCASETTPPTTAPSTTDTPEPAATEPTADAPAADATAETEVADDVAAVLAEFVTTLDTELKLQPKQQQAVRTVLSEHASAMQPHLEAIVASPSRMAKMRAAQAHRPPMDAIRQQTDDRMRAVLDEDQFARYQVLREDLRRELKATVQRRHG
ncbi:MAG: hypothetical protein AAF799_15600 [Myxococcota bacterium]